mgnify:FL=1
MLRPPPPPPVLSGVAAAVKRAGVKLRWYQRQIKQDIYNAWGGKRSNVLAVLPTGAGKTVVFSDIRAEHNGASCAIAHRQELVSQISVALARNGVKHRIIGPKNVIRQVVNLHMMEVGASFYDPAAPVGVAGVDTLIRRGRELSAWLNRVTLWVQDECFPAGTLVDGKPIEDIQPGQYVDAFNEVTGCVERRKVVRQFKNPMPDEMVKVVTRSHHVLKCTKGHPFWTRRGWVNAADLTTDDEVLLHDDRMHLVWNANNQNYGVSTVQIPENRSDILSKIMRLFTSRPPSTAAVTKGSVDQVHNVRHPRHGSRLEIETVGGYGAGLLLHRLRQRLSPVAVKRNGNKNEQAPCQSTHESEKPDVRPTNPGESEPKAEGHESLTPHSRRQRETGNNGRERPVFYACRRWVRSTARRSNGFIVAMASSLQNRLCKSKTENSDRSGWRESQVTGEKRTGPKKGRLSDWCRLESVQILKRNNPEFPAGGFVYNIEVEGLHTYVAGGVVVHNCHHVLESNKWGQAAEMFPHAKGLGVTATPCRADRKGLGRHADGLFDVLVEGPNMRDLIDEGFLTDYRVLAPDPAFVMNDETDVGSTGDYKRDAVVKKFRASKNKVIGDVVSHYLKHAVGKLGITFVPDVEDATDTAAAFNAVGVPAEVVSAKTPDTERAEILRRFKRRELLQLVNVDLFGEGFDLPAIEVVSMARPTASFSLFVQQFGRALRLMVDPALMSQWDDFTPEQRRAHIAASDKPRALILDHVGNVQRHKLPDRRMSWTLDRGDKRQRAANDDAIPVKACPECTFVYEAVKPCCPECGYKPLPMARSRPEFVDGDLIELTPEALAALREEVDQMDKPAHQIVAEKHIPLAGQRRFARIHAEDQEAQRVLRESIAWWGGYQRAMNRCDSESYKRFYFMFGVDVMTAQTLKRVEAEALTARINDHLGDVRDAG